MRSPISAAAAAVTSRRQRLSQELTILCFLSIVYFVSGASVPISHGHFKPSLSELTVPFRENPKIILTHFPGQSVVIPLLSGQSSASNYLVHVARQAGHSDPGHFYVEAPHGYGVMAVIQRLHLRRISDDKSLLHLVNNCKDYIEFEGQNGEKTIPICGSLDKNDDSFYPPNLHGPKFFNSNNGRMKVTFRNHYNYGNDILASNDSHISNNQEMITAEIAFTAFSRCDEASTPNRFHCTHDKCIDALLKCDKIEQCAPGENEGVVGFDERNCTRNLPTVATPTSGSDDFLSLFGSSETFGDEDAEELDLSQVIAIPSDDSAEVDFESKLPNMTTICALVVILCIITVCGYFWGWLSQLCCAARSLVRSAGSSPTSSQHSVCTPPVRAGQQQAPRRRSLDGGSTPYYVPAVVLRPMGDPGSTDGPNFSKTYLKEDHPPTYDMLFPKGSDQDSKL